MPKKPKNSCIFHLPDSVYKQDPAVYVGPHSEFRKYLKEKYDYAPEGFNAALRDGVTLCLEDVEQSQVYIWLENWDSTYNAVSCLMHECIHAAMDVMCMVEVPVTVKEHEAMAYYASSIFMEAHRKLDKAFPLKKKVLHTKTKQSKTKQKGDTNALRKRKAS